MIEESATRFNNGDWFKMSIDTDIPTCEVTGFIDGEPVDFSGGGGSSDFNTATVTLMSDNHTPAGYSDYQLYGTDQLDYSDDLYGAVKDEGVWILGKRIKVNANTSTDVDVMFVSGKFLYVADNSGDNVEPIVTGAAETFQNEYNVWGVKVTGDCTITTRSL